MSDTLISSIYSVLSADADIIALVGDRIYPVRAPQRTPQPYIVFTQVSGNASNHVSAQSNEREARIQVDIFARRYAIGDELRDSVISALQARSEIMSSTDVWFCSLEFSSQDYFDSDDLFKFSLDFRWVYSIPPRQNN